MVEDIVGNLIGTEGLDLVLIGEPARLSATSTDRLTLETLSGDVAVLDWKCPEEITRELDRIPFAVQRARHPHDPAAPNRSEVATRGMYAFDLNRFGSSRELISALQDLNARRGVRIFSLGLPDSAPASAQPNHAPRTRDGTSLDATSGSGISGNPTSGNGSRDQSGGLLSVSSAKRAPTAGSSGDPLDLDDLIDQLDKADP